MIETLPPKSPAEVLDYLIDASDLLQAGETLLSGSSTITVTGGIKDSQSFTDTSVTVWISGGTAGVPIRITALLATSGGRTFERKYVLSLGEPISLKDAKAHLRVIDNDTEDDLIADLIAAARAWVEDYTGHILLKREVTVQYAAWGDYLTVWPTPVVSVDDVTYTDADGADQTFEGYSYAAGQRPTKLYPVDEFPTLGDNGTVTVTLTAGYADGEIPEPLLQAIKIILAGMFKNRGGPWTEAETAAKSLCRLYRQPVFA